jgi:hypothetical protein
MTPARRADAILRGWITEAVGTGTAHEDQLRAFIADAIRDAEASVKERCARRLERMAYDRALAVASMSHEIREMAKIRCEEDLEAAAAIRSLE